MERETRHVAVFWAGLALALAAGAARADDHDERYALLFGPRDVIGPRLEDWADYFGPDYVLNETRGFPNPHSKQPMVGLRMSHAGTSVTFVVNLVTNEHFMVQVSSASERFLETMGVERIRPEPGASRTVVDDWDVGLNELTITRKPDGALSAQWIYYLD